MKIMSSNLCRRRYKVQIKAARVAKRNKTNIFFFCIIAIAVFILTRVR